MMNIIDLQVFILDLSQASRFKQLMDYLTDLLVQLDASLLNNVVPPSLNAFLPSLGFF